MIRTNNRPLETHENTLSALTLPELRAFGERASSRLPNLGRDRGNARDARRAIEVAENGPGGAMGGLAGGWLGGVLGSRLPLGEFGKWAGRYLGAKAGEALGSQLDGPVPESVARGVMTPAERDYPGYWGYSGDDAVGGWRPDRTRQGRATTQSTDATQSRRNQPHAVREGLPKAYADRIASDFGNEWHDAYEIYGQNPEFWEEAYKGDPNVSKAGPNMPAVPRTSRLPAARDEDAAPKGSTFWDGLFPGRASLREAQGKWRE